MNNTPKTNKQQIIEKYCLIVKEFVDRIKTSETIIKSNQSIFSLSVGLNSIHRVFEYTLLKTKQIDMAYYTAQQSYYYFLEYIEQINDSQLMNNLNHKDAIMFVYKKAIFDVHDGNINDKSTPLTNIMSLTSTINISDKEWRTLFIRISKFINAFLCWNNYLYDFSFRIDICVRFLERYLLNIERLDFTTYYLEYMHQNIPIDKEKYIDILEHMLLKSEKTKRIRSGSITEQEKNEVIFNKLSIENNIFKHKFDTLTTDKFVEWLLSE